MLKHTKVVPSETKLKALSVFIYCIFFILLIYLHKDVFPYSDDNVFRGYLTQYTIAEQVTRTWKELSGKVFTDITGALLTLLSYRTWSIIDSLVWLGLYYMFGDIIFGMPSYQRLSGNIVLAALFLMFPVYYLTSAGFIMTSSNYVYPAVCDTFVIWRILKHLRHSNSESTRIFSTSMIVESILLIMAALYGAGQEQSAIILISLLVYILIIQLRPWLIGQDQRNNKSLFMTILSLICAIAGFLFVFISPAHINRSRSVEGFYSIPGYDNWNIIDKFLNGYSSTVANLIFYQTWIYLTFCLILLFLGFCQRKKFLRILSTVPAVYSFTAALLLQSSLSFYPDYGWGMKALKAFDNPILNIINNLIPLLVFLLICYLIYQLFDNKFTAVTIILVLTIGLGSRVIMGLSATLYGSSFRTFIYLLFCLIFCGGSLYKEITAKNKQISYIVMFIVCIIAVRIVYLNSIIIRFFKRNGVRFVKY